MNAKEIAVQIVRKNLETELDKYSEEVKYALERSIELRIMEYGLSITEQVLNKVCFDVDRGVVLKEEINY